MKIGAAKKISKIYGIRNFRLERALIEKRKAYLKYEEEVNGLVERLRKNDLKRNSLIDRWAVCAGTILSHQLQEFDDELALADEETDKITSYLEHLLTEQNRSRQTFETAKKEWLSLELKKKWLEKRFKYYGPSDEQ